MKRLSFIKLKEKIIIANNRRKCKQKSFMKKRKDIPMIALTFDDGPSIYTSEILTELRENHAKATFFVLGRNVEKYPNVLKEISEYGCEIGNHTYNHQNLVELSLFELRKEISMMNKLIKSITHKRCTLFRCPGGHCDSRTRILARMPIVMWSLDTLDWKTRDTQKTIDAVLNHVEDGDIVLMHDIHQPTITAAKIIIHDLTKRGYRLVTVSELMKARAKGLNWVRIVRNLKPIKK